MPADAPVDLRSDTVTRPTPGMREAIASAVVGDDVYDDDPTVHALQERVAALCGKPRALFVPSGTMGNQLAIRCQTTPGDEVLVERDSHIVNYEVAGAAALSGVQLTPLVGVRGALSPRQVEDAVRGGDVHEPRTRLLCMENTHHRAGGVVLPLAGLAATARAARERGLAVHLDGARLWNAAVASGVPLAEWAAPVDTVTMCFSKGLGAPIGSILVGETALIERARRFRKMFGGGMRQAGVLAAAALFALDHHVARLADDHRRARRLADHLRQIPGLSVESDAPETNLLFFQVTDPGWEAPALVASLAERGIRMSMYGPRTIRAVTHLDVDDAAIDRAGAALAELLAAPVRPA